MTSRRASRGCIPKTTIPRALGGWSADERRRVLGLLVVATVAQLRIFLTFERQMKRTGGPGIIPFELAGSTDKARQIVDSWGDHGRSAARKSLFLDFVFPPTYAALQALACDAAAEGLAKRERGTLAAAGTPIAWAQLAAAIFDYVENTALLLVLAGRDRRTPGLARRAALVKFALLSLGQGYILLGTLAPVRSRSTGRSRRKRRCR